MLMVKSTWLLLSYRDGDKVAQFGGASTIPSRMSVLTVFDITLEDSRSYSCIIRNTNLIEQVILQVQPASSMCPICVHDINNGF